MSKLADIGKAQDQGVSYEVLEAAHDEIARLVAENARLKATIEAQQAQAERMGWQSAAACPAFTPVWVLVPWGSALEVHLASYHPAGNLYFSYCDKDFLPAGTPPVYWMPLCPLPSGESREVVTPSEPPLAADGWARPQEKGAQ